MQIYKNKNPYYRTLMVLSVSRILLCVLPVFVLVFLLWRMKSKDFLEAALFAVLLVGIIITYAALSRRYRILLSGHNGERALLKIIKQIHWHGETAVFTNLPVFHKKNHSEIDMLLVGERGILIIEVKNHSGVIIGEENDDFWVQRKKFREGKSIQKKMINPVIQLRRQRGIIKNLLRDYNLDVWVENALFFSNPNVRLRLSLGKSNRAFSDKDELIHFINFQKPKKQLTKEQVRVIIDIIREMSDSH
ncbi:MAG: NERD domain-containing protein [Oscillospiraceae bacterium]|nr:NERD domain-containing protein [Oscillospiraceae bacterium]